MKHYHRCEEKVNAVKWCLTINGEGFMLDVDNAPEGPCGFYQVHWVEAPSLENATAIAFQRIMSDPHLEDWIGKRGMASLSLRLEEWKNVDSFDDVECNPTGYNFYPCRGPRRRKRRGPRPKRRRRPDEPDRSGAGKST